MEIKIIRNKESQKIVIKSNNKKKLEINMKIWKSLNIQNNIFINKEERKWNQKIKNNLIRLKIILFLRESGLLI